MSLRTQGVAPLSEAHALDKPYTSYSRLMSYVKCPTYYNFKYVLEAVGKDTLEDYFALGVLTHSLLEWKLKYPQRTLEGIVSDVVPHWLDGINVSFTSLRLQEFIQTTETLAELLYRSSTSYTGDHPIRTQQGQILKDPVNYPSIEFKREFIKTNVHHSQLALDTNAISLQPLLSDISLTWLAAKAISYAKGFSLPCWHYKTLNVELAFSTDKENTFPLPNTDVYLHGKIDWVVSTTDDRVVLIDHKTSKIPPLGEDVLHNLQLNVYAVVYKHLYGKYPDLISIHHVPSNKFIIAKLDPEIAERSMSHLMEVQQQTERGTTLKRHPTDYMSECIRRDYKTHMVKHTCPYIEKCWPLYVETLGTIGVGGKS